MKQQQLEDIIGYTFEDKALLTRALTHASASEEHLERQEFLGDSVLGLTIAEYLYLQYAQMPEGDLSKMKANLVCKDALLRIAKAWQLEHFLWVGAGERHHQGQLKSQSIAANAVEAVIGAVFLDGGWDKAKSLILSAWQPLLAEVQPSDLRDAKSKLQELTQAHALGLPVYRIQDLGTKATPRFLAECFVRDKLVGVGRGSRKKTAELDAAQQALHHEMLQRFLKA